MQLQNEGFIGCFIPNLPLLEGTYSVDIILKYGQDVTFDFESAFQLEVEKGDFFGTGKINADMQNGIIIYHKWNVN
jgi:hypothetical protein